MINLNNIKKKIENNTFQKTIKLTFLSIFSNSVVFLVPIFISFKYEISHHTDNFFLSYTIITFIAVIFSEAFKSVSIPFLKSKQSSKKEFAKTETLNNAYSPIKIYNIKINIMSDDNSKEKNIILFLKENFKINLVRK